MQFQDIKNIDITNKKILIRVDFNVPLSNGKITDDTRIQATLPTLKYLISKNVPIGIMSHLGQPKDPSEFDKFTLLPIAHYLEKLLPIPVKLVNLESHDNQLSNDHITLFENVRFLKGETKNDLDLAKKMASFCDIFIMDAFASAHRAHASTTGITKFAKLSLAGPLVIQEVSAITKAINNPKKPIVAIIGGAKISSKLPLLFSLVKKVNYLILGGGIANTCLFALGNKIGRSFFEPDALTQAKLLFKENKDKIPLPIDVLVSKDLKTDYIVHPIDVADILEDDIIGDIGPKTAKNYMDIIANAQTIIWNGPVGIFEVEPFSRGTNLIAKAISKTSAYSIIGGGDTISAINKAAVMKQISYVCTGGGAFLAFLENPNLPGLINLKTE
jgi:phosphoglycerate kinase